MMDVYYKLEYSNFKYDINFHGSGTEKQLDKLLGHFSNIGRLYFSNILTRSDLKFLEYEFLIIYQNQNIKSYLLFLDTGSKLVELTPKSLITLEKQENYLNKKIRIKSTVSVVTKSILLWIT